jgi:haloacetate dehalogenase
VDTLRDPDRAHAICEEYRAAATIDRTDDRRDRDAGRRVACPLLVLWSARGPVATWYTEGPIAIWEAAATSVRGQAVDGGHFFPEEKAVETADLLAAFCAGRERSA